MTSLVRRSRALPIAVVCALAFAFGPALLARVQEGADKTVFVTVTDAASGKPVTDLKTEHFVVAEDNVQRVVKSAKLTTQPVFVELLVDTSQSAGTSGTTMAGSNVSVNIIQDMRKALVSFVDDVTAASPENQVAVMEFGQASITVAKFTSKAPDLEKAINKLFPIPGADSVLSEAIIQASGDLQKVASPRRVIMIFNIEPGNETSRVQPKQLEDAVKKGQASLWAVSLRPGANSNSMSNVVLPALAGNSGGRREVIVGQSAIIEQFKTFWTQINSQYEVTYTRPAATPTASVVNVGVRADGVKFYTSRYPPK